MNARNSKKNSGYAGGLGGFFDNCKANFLKSSFLSLHILLGSKCVMSVASEVSTRPSGAELGIFADFIMTRYLTVMGLLLYRAGAHHHLTIFF